MNEDKSKLILTLLLINRGDPLNNSYKIMRILEWKFRTLWSKKILDEIKDKHYAEYNIVNAIHFYKLSPLGREFIEQEFDTALEFLLKNYPEEREFTTNVFNSFSPQTIGEIKNET